MGPRLALAAVAVVGALVAAGCGADDDVGGTAPAPEIPPRSPLLRIAIAEPVGSLDPLYARTRGERLISRQIYEPPVSRESGPYSESEGRIGPGRGLTSAAGDRQWRLRLRPGVFFQDGTPLDASAVTANVDRWTDTGLAARLMPGLIAVEALRPGLVRFRFAEPVPELPALLADARLGLVPPAEIESRGSAPIRPGTPGTGPFELRERAFDRLLLARHSEWWGTRLGVGPGLERLEFVVTDGELERFELLADGAVAVADELGPLSAGDLRREPLLAVVRSGGSGIGLERSVRGIDSASPTQSLADTWLTELR